MKIELNPIFKCLAAFDDTIAAGTRGGSIVFWDANTGREQAACRVGATAIASIVPHWLAADQTGTLHVIENSAVLRSVTHEPAPFMALSTDPKALLTAHSGLVLRDAQTLEVLKRGPDIDGRVRSAACSPVGTAFAVADRSLLLWRPEEGDAERRELACAFVDFLDHAHLVVGNGEWVDVYDLADWSRKRALRCFDGNITCGWLDRAARIVYVGTDRGYVVPFDLSAGQPRRPAALGSSPVVALAPLRDGLAALQERALHLLARSSLESRGTLGRHGESADLADFHPHKELLVSSDAHSIRLWNHRTGVQLNALQEEQPINAVSTTISPDGSLVAFATYGSTQIHLFDVAAARETMLDVRALVYQLRFAPTNRYLGLLSTYDAIALVSMADHKQTILPGQYRAFTFSQPTGLVAGIAVDNTLRIFDYTGRNSLFNQRLDGEIARVEFGAGEDCVGLLDFSSNIRTINLDTGREVCRVACPDPTDDVRFAVADEGKLVAAGSQRGFVQIFYEGQKLAEFKLERELRRLSIHDDKLWCACVESTGPDTAPTCFAEAASFNVAYEALFTYKLSGLGT